MPALFLIGKHAEHMRYVGDDLVQVSVTAYLHVLKVDARDEATDPYKHIQNALFFLR